jgi:hypothetical protein
MIGVYSMYVFGEGLKGREGHINIDFLKATTSGSPASPKLRGAIKTIAILSRRLQKTPHRLDKIEVLEARFGTDQVYGPHFTSYSRE